MVDRHPDLRAAHLLGLWGNAERAANRLEQVVPGDLDAADGLYLDYIRARLTDDRDRLRQLYQQATALHLAPLAQLARARVASIDGDASTADACSAALRVSGPIVFEAEARLLAAQLHPDDAALRSVWRDHRETEGRPCAMIAALKVGDRSRISGDLEAADRWYERAIALGDDAPAPHFVAVRGRALLAQRRGDPNTALAMLRALDLSPLPPWAHRTLALSLAELGQVGDADSLRSTLPSPADTVERMCDALCAFYAERPIDPALLEVPTTEAVHRHWTSIRVLLRHLEGLEHHPASLWRAVSGLQGSTHAKPLLTALANRRANPADPTGMRLQRALFAIDPTSVADFVSQMVDGPIPVGPYDLYACIGSGAHGSVYLGRHHEGGRPVAVKVLERITPNADAEARLAARLQHPNVARILDYGTLDAFAAHCAPGLLVEGAHYVVMERIQGASLEGAVLAWHEVRTVLVEALDALAHAHARGVLHLDLKPANIMKDARGTTRIVDFGVAAMLSTLDASRLRVAGTPLFMAPEQWSGRLEQLGPWTDLYCLGCTAWTLLTGRPLFQAHDFDRIARLHKTAERPALDRGSRALEHWLHTLLAIDPTERFRSASEAQDALLALSVDGPERARGASTPVDDRTQATVLHSLSDDLAAPHDVLPVRSPALRPVELGREWSGSTCRESPLATEGIARLRLLGAAVPGWEDVHAALWRALGEVAARLEGRVIALSVMPGEDPEPLLRWLVLRARERGIIGHHLDLAQPEAILNDIIGRTSMTNVDPHRWWSRHFARPAPDEPIDALCLELSRGPGVLAISGDPSEELLVRLHRLPCLIVLTRRHAHADQVLPLRRCEPGTVLKALAQRLRFGPVLEDIASRAAGRPGLALTLLRDLLDAGIVVSDGTRWSVLKDATLSGHAPDPRLLFRDWLNASPDRETVVLRCLSGVSLLGHVDAETEADLRVFDLLDDTGLLREDAWSSVAEVGVQLGLVPPDAMPRHMRLEWDVASGQLESAIETLCDLAVEAAPRYDLGRLIELLSRASELAMVGALTLPSRYWLMRGRSLALTEPHVAEHCYAMAARDPALEVEATVARAGLTSTSRKGSIALLERLLDRPDPDGIVRMRLGIHLAREGRVEDAVALVAGSDVPRCRYLLLSLSRPHTRDANWLSAMLALSEHAGAAASAALAEIAWLPASAPPVTLSSSVGKGLHPLLRLNDAIRRENPAQVEACLAERVILTYRMAARLWLDVDAEEAIWQATLDQARPHSRFLPAESWILYRAAERASRADRRDALLALCLAPVPMR